MTTLVPSPAESIIQSKVGMFGQWNAIEELLPVEDTLLSLHTVFSEMSIAELMVGSYHR